MADSILVRFEDDLAKQLRDRARQEQKSITGFINDAVKTYLEQLGKIDQGENAAKQRTSEAIRRFGTRLADAHHSIAAKTDPWEALNALLDCIEIRSDEDADNTERITWDQFLYAPENERGDETEARRLFAVNYNDIAQRDWTWYLQTCDSDDEAKAVWLRQRRRYGIPVPPESLK